MFGYLQIHKSELRVRELEAYEAVYCGLCKQMGKEYSFLSRFGLSYDCTYYAMLLMSLSRSCKSFKDGRCTFNPLKKCKYANCEDNAYHKASAFAIISAYYKIKDDISDSKFFKRLISYLLLPFYSHWRKKAKTQYPELDNYTLEMMDLQAQAEINPEYTVDMSAHPTANMLANVFADEGKDEIQRRVFYEFGYHLGRWIYLIDAADDLIKDKKNNNFNPFIKKNNELYSVDLISAMLNGSLARAYDAYNLIDIIDFKGILDNMILLGFPTVQNRVIEKLKSEVTDE